MNNNRFEAYSLKSEAFAVTMASQISSKRPHSAIENCDKDGWYDSHITAERKEANAAVARQQRLFLKTLKSHRSEEVQMISDKVKAAATDSAKKIRKMPRVMEPQSSDDEEFARKLDQEQAQRSSTASLMKSLYGEETKKVYKSSLLRDCLSESPDLKQMQKNRREQREKDMLRKAGGGIVDLTEDVGLVDSDDEQPVQRKRLGKNRLKRQVSDDDSDSTPKATSVSMSMNGKKLMKEAPKNLDKDEATSAKERSTVHLLEDDDWSDEERSRAEIQRVAHRLLVKCKKISDALRKNLLEWGAGRVSTSKKSIEADRFGNCITLTQLSSPISVSATDDCDSGHLLSTEDVEGYCCNLKLKDYQLVGVNWLRLLHENNVNGVLADDMGLGKTVQTIAFLVWLQSYRQLRNEPHLPSIIIVPASTLSNWQNELAKFAPDRRVVTYHGSQHERMELRLSLKAAIAEQDVDIILSTYTVFEREASKPDRKFLQKIEFDYMVLDEAHSIKNANSSRHQFLNVMNTQHRLLLSGTPVQNDVSDLLSMLSFLMPDLFRRRNCEMLQEAMQWQETDPNNGSGGTMQTVAQLRGMLAPFVMRRLKVDVLDQLPKKILVIHSVQMTPLQKSVYESIIRDHTQRKEQQRNAAQQLLKEERYLLGCMKPKPAEASNCLTHDTNLTATSTAVEETSSTAISEPVPASISRSSTSASLPKMTNDDEPPVVSPDDQQEAKPDGSGNAMSNSEAQHLFTQLRKAANHPLLLRVRYQDPAVLERIATIAFHAGHFGNQCDLKRVREEIDKFSDFDLHQLCLTYPDSLGKHRLEAEVMFDSPKMLLLKEMLPKLQSEGHRILIFSQWTRLLDLLEVFLSSLPMQYLRLDGSTPVKERQELIDQFNTDASIGVFLLSTKAGGLGINLTAADTVIMHDLDFNPENDKQAEDRCYRIGQTKPVTVYKLYTESTVDEDIYELGVKKQQLSHALLSEDDATKKSRGKRDGGDLSMISAILQRALSKASSST